MCRPSNLVDSNALPFPVKLNVAAGKDGKTDSKTGREERVIDTSGTVDSLASIFQERAAGRQTGIQMGFGSAVTHGLRVACGQSVDNRLDL